MLLCVSSILHPSDILQEYISTCKGLQEPELNTRARGCLERMLKFPQYGFDFYDLSRLLLAEDVHTPSSYAQSCDLWEQHIDKTIPEDTHFRDVVQTFMTQDLTQKDRGTSSWELKQQVTNVRDLMFAALCVWSDFRNSCGDSAFFAFARAAVKVVLHNSQDLNLYLKVLFPRTTLYLLPSTEYHVQSVHMSNYTQLFLEGAEDGTSTLVLDGSLVFTRKAQLKNLTIRNKEGNMFICTFDGNCSDDGMSLLNVKFQNVKLYVEYGGSILMDHVTFDNCAHALVANYLKELVLKNCKILNCQAGIIGNEIDKIELHSLHVNGIPENRLFNINTKDVLFNGLSAPNVDKIGIINLPPMVPVRVGPRSDFTMFRRNASDLVCLMHAPF